MKRAIALIMVLCMFLCACDENTEAVSETSDTTDTSQTESVTSTDTTEETTAPDGSENETKPHNSDASQGGDRPHDPDTTEGNGTDTTIQDVTSPDTTAPDENDADGYWEYEYWGNGNIKKQTWFNKKAIRQYSNEFREDKSKERDTYYYEDGKQKKHTVLYDESGEFLVYEGFHANGNIKARFHSSFIDGDPNKKFGYNGNCFDEEGGLYNEMFVDDDLKPIKIINFDLCEGRCSKNTEYYDDEVLTRVEEYYHENCKVSWIQYVIFYNPDGSVRLKFTLTKDGTASPIYEYYENGDLKTEFCYYKDVGIIIKTTYEYYSKGVLKYKRLYHENYSGNVVLLGYWEYASDGTLLHHIDYNSDDDISYEIIYYESGKIHFEYEYEDSSKGYLLEAYEYDEDGTCIYYSVYEYWESGSPKSKTVYAGIGGEIVEYEEYPHITEPSKEYYPNGKLKKEIFCYDNGVVSIIVDYREDGSLSGRQEFGTDGIISVSYNYNAEGKLVNYNEWNSKGTATVLGIIYDDNGVIRSKTETSDDGTYTKETNYDNRGVRTNCVESYGQNNRKTTYYTGTNGELVSKIVDSDGEWQFKYTAEGKLQHIQRYKTGFTSVLTLYFKQADTTKYEYGNDGTLSITECYDSGSVRVVTKLNKDLIPTAQTYYLEDGTLNSHIVYRPTGYREKCEVYNEDGSIRLTYEYDEKGNMIQ